MIPGNENRTDSHEPDASGLDAQGEVVTQGMARLNVRVGDGHARTAARTSERRYPRGGVIALMIMAIALAVLVTWMLLV